MGGTFFTISCHGYDIDPIHTPLVTEGMGGTS